MRTKKSWIIRREEEDSTEGRLGLVDSSSLVGILLNNHISISEENIAALVTFNICILLCFRHLCRIRFGKNHVKLESGVFSGWTHVKEIDS